MADEAGIPVNQASHIPEARPGSPEGRTFHPMNDAELADAIEKAFDYRGDVTLALDDGTRIEGYLANRDSLAGTVDFFPRDGDAKQFPYARIKSICLSGHDAADGKSWENWMAKKAEQRKAEAERIRQEAIARGEL